ncbi:serine/threonine-protein kinase [Nannocystis sp. ILAH1]|uniref:serine/threonine protein kinase n=1 Tax=unclassified Nannocystis TaxID=2627009 RepID=UPI00226E691E|nr:MULTISPECIES: serine/threonine-protein kinase [unclassified Nannocystis]MCY0988303.1 serine/threonine-protein kinase [Nannocystis sp. ILAH1]MCY1067736.1 serine/threonine-protein kinase [Nannocystis sp. RBIL2]
MTYRATIALFGGVRTVPSSVRTMELEPETKVLPRGNADVASPPPGDGSLHALQRIGRYEVVQRLGHGGMATVYLGRATGSAGFERVVAIKVIHQHLAAEPEFVGMFLDEAKIAARIHSPHVAGILDLGEDSGFYFMVLEYIDGETLSALLRQLRPADERLPLAVALQVLADACEGLVAVHGLRDPDGRPYGLVHRDMSPQNLMVNFDGWTKIVDFGLVKATGLRNSNHTGHLRGKLAYMAPEQARGKPLSAGTDLFALGVIFWEMLTGRRLFAGEGDAETLENVMRCEVPPLREFRPDLPSGVEALLQRALAPTPEERYASAEAMLADIRALLRECGDTSEPRRALGAIMRHHFAEQAKYRMAAIRGASRGELRGRPAHIGSAPLPAAELSPPPVAAGDEQTQTRVLAETRGAVPVPDDMSSPTDRLAVVPTRRPWLLWLSLPLVGAGVAAVLLLFLLPRQSPPQPEPSSAPAPTVPQPQVQPPRPATVVWFFQTDPVGATVTIDKGPESVLAALAPQIEGQVTPLRLVVPYDDQVQLQLTVTHEGYKPSKRSLIPMDNQNFIVELQPEAPTPVPAITPVTNTLASPKKKPPSAKNPGVGATEPAKPASKSEKGEESELKDEPIFSPVKGGG